MKSTHERKTPARSIIRWRNFSKTEGSIVVKVKVRVDGWSNHHDHDHHQPIIKIDHVPMQAIPGEPLVLIIHIKRNHKNGWHYDVWGEL